MTAEPLPPQMVATTGPMQRFLAAVNGSIGLVHDFIYHIPVEDYRGFPEPCLRTTVRVQEVEERVERYRNPARPAENYRWDIHGRLLLPAVRSLANVAMVIVHGGAQNEYEFLFTPDGPETFQDLTRTAPSQSRAGLAQHIASLGIPVLTVSLPGHYSRADWPALAIRRPEFVIGEIPDDAELQNRLAIFTYRMCLEALKLLIERHLPGYDLFLWGPSTGAEYFYLLEQYGLKNRLVGGLGFGTGPPAALIRDARLAIGAPESVRRRQELELRSVHDLIRRSPDDAMAIRVASLNALWGSPERWFAMENHRRPQFKPMLQEIEHQGLESLSAEVRATSGLPDEELFITLRADPERQRDKRLLYFVGEFDRGNWVDGGSRGMEFRRIVFGLRQIAAFADRVRLVVIPGLTHYGHTELHNERLANMMVAAILQYFPSPA